MSVCICKEAGTQGPPSFFPFVPRSPNGKGTVRASAGVLLSRGLERITQSFSESQNRTHTHTHTHTATHTHNRHRTGWSVHSCTRTLIGLAKHTRGKIVQKGAAQAQAHAHTNTRFLWVVCAMSVFFTPMRLKFGMCVWVPRSFSKTGKSSPKETGQHREPPVR